MPETLIEIRDLSRRDLKAGRLLLNRIDLVIRRGERIGLVGPTGSGKSSLLRAIVKLDRCESGELHFRSESVIHDDVPGFRRQVVYLPQRPAFVTGTVRSNLELPFRFSTSEGRYDDSRVIGWLEKFSRSRQMLDQPIDELSGGEQQIVALIRAISFSPQILLLDEPTASLDADATGRFERLVLAWQQELDISTGTSRALMWTSHDAEQVRRMTTRIVEMRGGVLTESGEDG
jgi:putative ABC transport system ATP-binding protein